MTVEQFKERVLAIIEGWRNHSTVQTNETCVTLLDALADDIGVIDIS